MIVKDEAHVIERCLTSVKPLIDYWVIVDTGSSDGTQQKIKEFMEGIPGELHERPWVDFAYNRNEALELAKKNSDYILIIDADDELVLEPGFSLPKLDRDYYYFTINHAGLRYQRTHLIDSRYDWKWTGVLHEYLSATQAKRSGVLENVSITYTGEGARSKDHQKFQKDAEVLKKALLKEPENSRYVFYLAQSLRDAKNYHEALMYYEQRVSMGGWDQEVFWSMLQVAYLQEWLKKDPKDIIKSYEKAFLYRPSRAEPLYRLANYYRLSNNFQDGYLAAKKGLLIPISQDILFVEKWIYEYGLLLEFSLCAYYTGRYEEAFLASNLIRAQPNLPERVKKCVEKNMSWIIPKVAKSIDSVFEPALP